MTENISKEHYLFEALREDPNVYVDKNDVKIGDTILYIANNQLGNKKYIVVKNVNENGNVEKSLQEIEFKYDGGKKKNKKTRHKRSRKQQIKSKSKKMKSKKHARKHTKSALLKGLAKGLTKGISDQQLCSNSLVKCNLLDKHYTENNKENEVWDTCIHMNGINNHIIYITPKNVVIKKIETAVIPEFAVKLSDENNKSLCKIMIKDKYVGCFLKICGHWYAFMRLFGKTFNSFILSKPDKNNSYYKIKNIEIEANDPEKGSGIIKIPKEYYENFNANPFFSTSKNKIIKLKENCFKKIDEENINEYNLLQRFRFQKILGAGEKEGVVYEFGDEVLENVF
jgi:hypothetical protein